MIRSFRHRGLKRLYERGDRSRVGADQAQRLAMALADLDDAVRPADIDLPGYGLHPLKGRLKGFWSITISGNWRIIFRFEEGDIYDVDPVDYHQPPGVQPHVDVEPPPIPAPASGRTA